MSLNRPPRRKPKFMVDFIRENPPRSSIGSTPLTHLADGYQGEAGGLYPDGRNAPSPDHYGLGIERAAEIVPRGPDGAPDADGKIGFISLGLSNTNFEFQVFMHLVSECDALNPALVLVNGAQSRKSAEIMETLKSNYWPTIDRRVRQENLTNEQVQIVWLKSALKQPAAAFPAEAKRLQRCLVNTMHILTARYPNLQLVYLSSRAYGGYSEIPLNPEPHAYESAFAIKWLIADQMAGDPELNCDPARGPVRCPWLCWGPYLWADGVRPRDDGLTYEREDMIWDGVHPSPRGREKIAGLLFDFMVTDQTTMSWFLRPGLAADVQIAIPSLHPPAEEDEPQRAPSLRESTTRLADG
jgi:hypothetical protein